MSFWGIFLISFLIISQKSGAGTQFKKEKEFLPGEILLSLACRFLMIQLNLGINLVNLEQWFHCSQRNPLATLETFLVVTTWGGCYWNLVSRGWERCLILTMYRTGHLPPWRNYLTQNVSCTEVSLKNEWKPIFTETILCGHCLSKLAWWKRRKYWFIYTWGRGSASVEFMACPFRGMITPRK